jgi:hypothetical protein
MPRNHRHNKLAYTPTKHNNKQGNYVNSGIERCMVQSCACAGARILGLEDGISNNTLQGVVRNGHLKDEAAASSA